MFPYSRKKSWLTWWRTKNIPYTRLPRSYGWAIAPPRPSSPTTNGWESFYLGMARRRPNKSSGRPKTLNLWRRMPTATKSIAPREFRARSPRKRKPRRRGVRASRRWRRGNIPCCLRLSPSITTWACPPTWRRQCDNFEVYFSPHHKPSKEYPLDIPLVGSRHQKLGVGTWWIWNRSRGETKWGRSWEGSGLGSMAVHPSWLVTSSHTCLVPWIRTRKSWFHSVSSLIIKIHWVLLDRDRESLQLWLNWPIRGQVLKPSISFLWNSDPFFL